MLAWHHSTEIQSVFQMKHRSQLHQGGHKTQITGWQGSRGEICIKSIAKPSLHIVVMVVGTARNMFLTLFQAILIHVKTLITTLQQCCKFKLNRNIRRIPFKTMYNISMLHHWFLNVFGAPEPLAFLFCKSV